MGCETHRNYHNTTPVMPKEQTKGRECGINKTTDYFPVLLANPFAGNSRSYIQVLPENKGCLMARIRTIKPEFWTSEQIAECDPLTRLLFIGALNFCDDSGVHPASAKRLKMEIFPSDDIASTSIRGMLDELSSNNLIELYKVEDKEYFIVTGWEKHQRIDRPTYKYPLQDGDIPKTCRRHVDERSPPERNGKEGNGEEGKGKRGAKRATPPPKDFSITAGMKSWAGEKAKNVNLERETEKFLNHAQAKGLTYKNWESAWRNWMLKSLEYNPPKKPTSPFPDVPGLI